MDDKRLELARGYALSSDGSRALVPVGTTDASPVEDLRIVYHWTDDLARSR